MPADHPEHPDTPASPAGLHRVAGGWCRTSDKSAGTTSACKVGNRVGQGGVLWCLPTILALQRFPQGCIAWWAAGTAHRTSLLKAFAACKVGRCDDDIRLMLGLYARHPSVMCSGSVCGAAWADLTAQRHALKSTLCAACPVEMRARACRHVVWF